MKYFQAQKNSIFVLVKNFHFFKIIQLNKKSAMKITVKLFSRPIYMEVEPNETVKDIKLRIDEMEKINVQIQRLVYARIPLDDEAKTIKECNIKPNSTLYLFLRLFTK